MGLQAGLWSEMRVSVYIKPIKLRHVHLNVIIHNILSISVSTMIFLRDLVRYFDPELPEHRF
jgi:hypothetical protein